MLSMSMKVVTGLVRSQMKDLLPAAVPGFKSAKVVDSYVQRFPGHASRPVSRQRLETFECGSSRHGSVDLLASIRSDTCVALSGVYLPTGSTF